MSLKKDGMIVILASPSGAGKTTLVNLISQKKKNSLIQFHIQRENLGAMK